MADRALIIAVERYDQAASGLTAKSLPGTLAAAKRFRAWLEAKWKAEGVTGTIAFCSTPKQAGGHGASSADLIDALVEIEREGRDQTENLYIYFSGHGFRVRGETLKLADVLVAADFKDVQRSAAACFKLDALVDGLRSSLGFGRHFYFIDACRNEVEKAIASNIMPFAGQGSVEPSVFVLQSTAPGAPALVAGPFASRLVEGLKGASTAKVWDPPGSDAMQVRFDSLRVFLKNALGNTQPISQSTSGEIGESEAVLATIRPIPEHTLTIALRTKLTPIKGTATVTSATGASTSHAIAGRSTKITLPAHHHTVALAIDGADVRPASAVADLRDDLKLEFDAFRPGEPFGVAITGRRDTTRVEVPSGAEIRLRHIGTGITETFRSSADATLAPGEYETTVRSSEGQILGRRQVEVGPGQPAVAPARWRGSVPHESIASLIPEQNGSVDFSESLGGPIADPDLGLWLAMLGAGRLMGTDGRYSKIGPLPLQDFSRERRGASPVYVLAGVPDDTMRLGVSLGGARTGRRVWVATKQPPRMRGLRQALLRPKPGPCLVTYQLGDQPAYTVASFASVNRGTLIVLTTDEDGQPRVAQYLLPISHLERYLPPEVRTSLESRRQEQPPLRDVQLLTQLYRAFRKRRNIAAEFSARQLDDLLHANWLEPIGASLAAYELIRRGKMSLVPTASANMTKYFSELPDTAAIARFAGATTGRPHGVPLFLDGVRAFGPDRRWLPFDAGLLDYVGPWTAWRGAVSSPRR